MVQYLTFIKKINNSIRNGNFGATVEIVRSATVKRLQTYIFEPYFRKNEAVDTRDIVKLGSLTIQSKNRDQGLPYQASPRQLVHIANQALPKDHASWTFIDIGAGRGRVLLEAATYPYREVLGIEFARELVEEGKLNLASSAHKQCKAQSINLLQADATNFAVPHGPCIFYLFNPFREDVVRDFLRHVMTSYVTEPRRFIFVYLNPKHVNVFSEFPELKFKKLSLKTSLILSIMVPYKLNIYELNPNCRRVQKRDHLREA